MGVLIDSSVLVDAERTGGASSDVLVGAGASSAFIAAITASELLHGVHRADSARRRARRERFVEAVLAAVPVLPFDLEVAREHARIWADLRREGLLIGAHDLLIAATAVTHGLRLLTANVREFGRVDGLDILRW